MKDLIERQAAIDAILHNQEVYSNNFGNDPIDKYTIAIIDNDAQTIAQLPSAQPEIIRCRDCIAYQEGIDIDGKPFTRCNGINGSVRTYGHTLPDWYCADAERRTDGVDS